MKKKSQGADKLFACPFCGKIPVPLSHWKTRKFEGLGCPAIDDICDDGPLIFNGDEETARMLWNDSILSKYKDTNRKEKLS